MAEAKLMRIARSQLRIRSMHPEGVQPSEVQPAEVYLDARGYVSVSALLGAVHWGKWWRPTHIRLRDIVFPVEGAFIGPIDVEELGSLGGSRESAVPVSLRDPVASLGLDLQRVLSKFARWRPLSRNASSQIKKDI
ncbi:hypothetical protein WJX72_003547 [[Myrmecia] bisecta]|uniref:Uncharacterized protein n=1 Tax=[Myrmecia] bisecta TaxID=41462 RepID=A0AAW1P9S8_9CHLO